MFHVQKSDKPLPVKKPEGMARELWHLLDSGKPIDTELAPLVPGGLATAGRLGGYKTSKAKFGLKRSRKWMWTLFRNEARRVGNIQPVLSHPKAEKLAALDGKTNIQLVSEFLCNIFLYVVVDLY